MPTVSQAKRQHEAAVRTLRRTGRTPEEQLALLDKRLGKGVGAKKERDRLNAILAKGKN